MTKLTIFIFLIILTSVYNQCTKSAAQSFLKRSIYEFTLKLAGRISQDTDSNFIISGLSPWNLLSTISLGATEDTQAEMARVLRTHPHKCFRQKYNQISRKLMTFKNRTVLEHSSAILVDNALEVSADFFSNASKAGVCNIEVLPFSDAIATKSYVNDMVSKATHEAINAVVTVNDIKGASIVMVDALYFKGAWKIRFSDTKANFFHNDMGSRIGYAYYMLVNGIFNITSVKQIQARVLEMPYGEDDRLSMLFFLPDIDATVNNLIDNLSNINLRTIFALFKRHEPENVAVQIPRFKMYSYMNLKELLMDMGLKKMFNRDEAQFDALASSPDLYVSNLRQLAAVEVTEYGKVASEFSLEFSLPPNQFIADKPFLFMIVDRDTEIPLFIGAYILPLDTYKTG